MEKDFSMIIIPDTQDLSTSHPDRLFKMTQWIVNHAEELNLKMILHVGDLVNNGMSKENQWQNHKAAFDLIDQSGIPLVFAIGNHDYDNILNENRNSEMFNKYCGMVRYLNKPWFGCMFEEGKTENMYAQLEIDGRKFLFLALEFGPRDEVLEWANDVLGTHSDYNAIVVTHSYMYLHGERTKPGDNHNPKIYKGAHGANDGEDLWHKCLKRHKNVIAVFSGHHITDHVSYRFDLGEQYNLIFQSFQNWQCADHGGDGRIRILRYRLSENRIELNVFNPQSEKDETDEGFITSFPIEVRKEQAEQFAVKKYPNSSVDTEK